MGPPDKGEGEKFRVDSEIFNVVAIIGCFYWGLESQMAVCGGSE